MAQPGHQLFSEKFSCSICLDLLKDPVAIPCGHSYCMSCIKTHWDGEDPKRKYSCPQCRKTFRPRPLLEKNIMLTDLVEELKKTGLQELHQKQKQKELELRRLKIQQRIQDREKDVKLLQQEVEAINGSADKAVEDSEKIFTELIRLIKKRRSDVKRQIRTQQETEVSQVKELQEKLEQEIAELKRMDEELEQLSRAEDHEQFLHSYSSLSPLSESFSINIYPLINFEDVTAAVSETRDKLQDILSETWTGGVLLPKTREEFLKYSREITLDPSTANTRLLLSEENRKATLMLQQQYYSNDPGRFTEYKQVLSRQSLTGRCYWEVEWRGRGVGVAVAYKSINRAGDSEQCVFGFNDKSWSLRCYTNSYIFWYNKVRSDISGPPSSKIGVYVDHRAGILSFYSISETMTLLHRVQTTFTEPLHAGLLLFYSNEDSAEFCKLR